MSAVNMRSLRSALLAGAAFILMAGCGGGDGAQRDASNPSDVDIDAGEPGGAATFLAAGDVDYLDPGLTYYTFGFMVQFAVNRALYQYEPGRTAPVPDLATTPPQISEDNRAITVRLRPDVRYAPPVQGVVTADDVKYAIERAFTTNVRSSYATSYFRFIEGAPKRPVPMSELEDFPGIDTPDDTTLVFKLTKPVAERVAAALTMPITVPVPRSHAQRYDRKEPSTYDEHVAFTGPYMVRRREPGERIELVRNPNWNPSTDFRPAYLDRITIEEGGRDLERMMDRTLSGSRILCCDVGQQLPPATLRKALDRFPTQVASVAAGGSRWIALNTQIPPFDNANVRKAVIAAADREALRDTHGGEEAGPVAQHYLPPGIPGFAESGGEEGFDDFDWMQAPAGDAELARRYMLAARAEGVPITQDGRYDGDQELLTIASNDAPGAETARVLRGQLQALGFRLDFRSVPQDTVFGEFCGNDRAAVAICADAAWFKDFADPEEMLRPTFSGAARDERDSVNWSELDVRPIDAAMRAASVLEGPDRARAWADVNRDIVEQAPGVPYLWDTAYQLASADLNAVMSPFSATWDLNYVSVK